MVGGDLDLAAKVIETYVTRYEELKFVNLDKYRFPVIGGCATFATHILEFLGQTKPVEEEKLNQEFVEIRYD